MKYRFTKLEGAGNDYLYFDGINQNINENQDFIQKISNRHFGVGSDGIIIALKPEKYDLKMRMYNADGSLGKMCGNGIRCFAKFCYENALTDKKHLIIETDSGLREVDLLFDNQEIKEVIVDMKEPIFKPNLIPCTLSGSEIINQKINIDLNDYYITALSMGNPHVVTFVKDVDSFDVAGVGLKIGTLDIFPQQANVGFCQIINRKHIKLRVFERGSGETLACGTGACAAMVAAYRNDLVDSKVRVDVLGGSLEISYENNKVIMKGPAKNVFTGEYEY